MRPLRQPVRLDCRLCGNDGGVTPARPHEIRYKRYGDFAGSGSGRGQPVVLRAVRHAVVEAAGVALATILALTLAALLAAGPIMRFLGAKIEAVITRLLGVLLAALAVQFVIDGVQVGLR